MPVGLANRRARFELEFKFKNDPPYGGTGVSRPVLNWLQVFVTVAASVSRTQSTRAETKCGPLSKCSNHFETWSYPWKAGRYTPIRATYRTFSDALSPSAGCCSVRLVNGHNDPRRHWRLEGCV